MVSGGGNCVEEQKHRSEPEFVNVREPRYRCQGIDSTSLCRMAGRYDKQGYVLACQTSQDGEIDSLESIAGLLKRLQIRAQLTRFALSGLQHIHNKDFVCTLLIAVLSTATPIPLSRRMLGLNPGLASTMGYIINTKAMSLTHLGAVLNKRLSVSNCNHYSLGTNDQTKTSVELRCYLLPQQLQVMLGT